jgi:hypothetical protein
LPGTSGGNGVVDLITGAYVARAGGSSNRRNSLSVDWPRTMVLNILYRNLLNNSLFMELMEQSLR